MAAFRPIFPSGVLPALSKEHGTMNTSASKTLLVGALALGCAVPPAVGAGELTVTRQKDGTLLITNTGLPPPGPSVPPADEGAIVKKVLPAVVPEEVSETEPVPQTVAPKQAAAPRAEPEDAKSGEEEKDKEKEKDREAAPTEMIGGGAGPLIVPASAATSPGAGMGPAVKASGSDGTGDGLPSESPDAPKAPPGVTTPTPRPGTDKSVPVREGPTSGDSQERYRDRVMLEASSGGTVKNPAVARRYLMMNRKAYQSAR